MLLPPPKPRQKFPLSKWEWAALLGLSLIPILAIGNGFYPSVFDGPAQVYLSIVGIAAAGAALIYYLLRPLGYLLLAALSLCGLALVFTFRAFVAVLNFMGAAWRGEIRP